MERTYRKVSKKIGIILSSISDYKPIRFGALQVHNFNLAKELSKEFKVVMISSFRWKFEKKVKINKNFEINSLYFPCYDFIKMNLLNKILSIIASFIFFGIQAAIKIIEHKFDIIIIQERNESIIPAITAKLLRKKLIYYEGNEYPWNLYRNYKPSPLSFAYNIFMGKIILKLVDMIVVQNSSIKEGMRKYTNKEIKIIPISVDINRFKYIPKEKEYIVGFLGRLEKEKGMDLLIDIIDLAYKEEPKIKFMIIGDGKYREILEKKKNVIFLSWVEREKLPEYIAKADVFLSCQEGIGMAEAEILACGRPLITLNSKVNKEIIKDRYNGFLCKANAKDYLEKMKKFFENGENFKEIQLNARITAELNFSTKEIAKKWIKIF